jgi:hypothetical protein
MTSWKDYNAFQQLNLGVTILIVSCIAYGLLPTINHSLTAGDTVGDLNSYLLAIFLLAFKVKTFLDDHKHFGDAHHEESKVSRMIGLLLAMGSWVFWAAAGYDVASPVLSAKAAIGSLGISSAWIFVHLAEMWLDARRRRHEGRTQQVRIAWFWVNLIYMMLLAEFVGFPVLHTSPGHGVFLVVLNVILVTDFVMSRPTALEPDDATAQ